ncbi:hypothetical protein CR983_00520 [Candidatus Saccharibacteria bacterium]|nr:MAG: hypothetical protein CR983_00520 [Candidatus Saccharibacteria bacterium]
MARTTDSSGFTIIEVVLFLAVSGLMITGMFVGISGGIGRERYSDAVAAFQDFIQGQYSLVDNVRNNREAGVPCRSGTLGPSATPQPRGTSDCTIVGRLVRTTDGRTFVSEPVYAFAEPNEEGTEIELLDSLQLHVAPASAKTDTERHLLAWDTYMYTDRTNKSARTAQLLIVRLPTSGVTRTFTMTNASTVLRDFWTGSASDLTMCVEPDGLVRSPANGVRVRSKATNANSVQFITAGEGAC